MTKKKTLKMNKENIIKDKNNKIVFGNAIFNNLPI
jgi:hypothetical protein